jgi:hypothetical protein
MSHVSRMLRKRKQPQRCDRCNRPIPEWPKGGTIVENSTGTESMKLCVKCLGIVLNTHGVKVIGDNIGRDQ